MYVSGVRTFKSGINLLLVDVCEFRVRSLVKYFI